MKENRSKSVHSRVWLKMLTCMRALPLFHLLSCYSSLCRCLAPFVHFFLFLFLCPPPLSLPIFRPERRRSQKAALASPLLCVQFIPPPALPPHSCLFLLTDAAATTASTSAAPFKHLVEQRQKSISFTHCFYHAARTAYFLLSPSLSLFLALAFARFLSDVLPITASDAVVVMLQIVLCLLP